MESFIETSIDKIREASNNNKLVIFVGAGVSANSNLPSWSDLIREFAEELGEKYEQNNSSLDYFLRIPQYYYLERGHKEYYDLINRVITNVESRPNDINRIIFKLNPSTIITTNFDELLEMTVKEQGLFYTTIKQDKDLPYCINDKLIIKMHGDAKLKNIVLKEEDYLNYSSNFPLIENYIKGLFSSKTILFIGYSAEDPDFKLIFNLVKSQLGGDFQPAYLLDISKENKRLEYNYYKNRGINILYYTDIGKKIEENSRLPYGTDINNEFGEKLYKFLLYIESREKEYDDKFEGIYNKLKIFEEMNSIYPNDICKVLGSEYYYDKFGHKELNIPQSEFMIKNYEIIEGDDEEKKKEVLSNEYIRKILNILQRASISMVIIGKRGRIINVDEYYNLFSKKNTNELSSVSKDSYQEESIDELFRNFKYNELRNYIRNFNSMEEMYGKEDHVLKIAFIMYNLGEYVNTYYILKKLSTYCYANRKYYHYFIAQFNLKCIHIILKNNDEYKKLQNNKEIDTELDSIDIKEKYMSLPKGVQDKVLFILEVENFKIFYKEVVKMNSNLEKLKDEKMRVENGGYSYSVDFKQSLNICNIINNYIERNFLMVNHYYKCQVNVVSF